MATLQIPMAPNTATDAEMESVFAQQGEYARMIGKTDYKIRKAKIKKLMDYVLAHKSEIEGVLEKDFHKHPTETTLTEILIVVAEAKDNLRNLKKWMKPKKIGTPMTQVGTSGRILPTPKGRTLIISPWNYPFSLAIGPLISAIGAGNVAMIKPSEMTPHTSAFIKKMVGDLFEEREVAVFEGNYEISQSLLAMPFNHIFFTGSPAVGKIVMAAAAKNLTSVTLELGGKSPAILDETAKVKDAAEKLAWGKCLNNGQTCIAPDYLLIHESKVEQFVEAFRAAVGNMYGEEGPQNNPSYCRIVNAKHFGRINALIADATERGANIVIGGHTDESQNYIEPTVLTGVTTDMSIMEEEIFGPVLPIVTWRNKEEVVDMINSLPAPLALYIFSRSKQNTNYFLQETRSGDVAVNDNLVHFSHPNLPFGGTNNSGIGKAHGYAGFMAFSHERSVLYQVFGTLKPLYPPYTDTVKKIGNFLMKMV
ncbi:MAG: aldehyde dehydrogenase family protein [Bacteroidia bacterium]